MTTAATPGSSPNDEAARTVVIKDRRTRGPLRSGALQNAILDSTGFSSIATDEKGVIQFFNAGASRMLGYAAAEVVNTFTPADLADPVEAIERASALSLEFGAAIAPGFEALVFKSLRGIEDTYAMTWVRKDGSRFPAVVSVSALHDPKGQIAGYLLLATDDTARKKIEAQVRGAEVRRADEKRQAHLRPPTRPERCTLLYVEVQPQPASPELVEQLIAGRTDVLLLRAASMDLGLELARTARPEVILLNVDLPGIGALEFMNRVRADPAMQSTPILALGANAAPVAIAKAVEAGFFEYLTQPMKAEAFMGALTDALEFAARERAEVDDMPSRAATQPLKESL
jgi:CheY-like chemotaxis protein